MKNKLLKGIIIVLSVLLALNISNVVIVTLQDLNRSEISETDIVYSLDNKDYDYLVASIYKLDINKASELQTDAYYLASYYEAAVLYKAYLGSGYEEKASVYENKMNEHKGKITLFSYHIDIINEQLSLV